MCGPTGIQILKAAASNRAAWLASGEPTEKQPVYSSRSSSSSSSSPRVIFPRRKSGEIKMSARPVKVTRQMLESLTHLPLPNACKKLGLCATTFKKACRREGIMQWPYTRGYAHAQEEEERAAKAFSAANAMNAIVMTSIIIEESSFASFSAHSEVDSTSTSSSPDESSDATFSLCSSSSHSYSYSLSFSSSPFPPSPPSSSRTSCSSPSYSSDTAAEDTSTDYDANAYLPSCAAKDTDFIERLEHVFFDGDLDLSYFRDTAMFDEQDAAFLRLTGWDAPM
jgi:hypothetical protein